MEEFVRRDIVYENRFTGDPPLEDPGLAMMFFFAVGTGGEDVFNDGVTYGPMLSGGKTRSKQMAPLTAGYANFTVYALK